MSHFTPMVHDSTARAVLLTFSELLAVAYTTLAVGGMFVQNIANYRNQSTKGFSTDFAITSFCGFLLLQFYLTLGLVNPFSEAGRVHFTDEILIILMMTSSSLALVQCMIYPSDTALKITWILCSIILGFFFFAGLLEGYAGIMLRSYFPLSLVQYAAVGKAISTFVKFSFQTYLNYNKKSVIGVSITTMAMDLTACILLVTQLQIDSIVAGAGFFIFDPRFNLAKFLMAFVSGVFDSAILIQYFYIYPESSRKQSVKDPLLK